MLKTYDSTSRFRFHTRLSNFSFSILLTLKKNPNKTKKQKQNKTKKNKQTNKQKNNNPDPMVLSAYGTIWKYSVSKVLVTSFESNIKGKQNIEHNEAKLIFSVITGGLS